MTGEGQMGLGRALAVALVLLGLAIPLSLAALAWSPLYLASACR